jgi:4-hydroxybenzoate polyprenyltransferase
MNRKSSKIPSVVLRALQSIIAAIEKSPISFGLWGATFFSIIVARLLIENWLGNFEHRDIQFLFSEFAHTALFFLFSYILFLVLLVKAAKTTIPQAANVLLWGFLIILTPPIFDFWISGGNGFWSFYEFDGLEGLLIRFLTFFGDDPTMGITYGVRIEVALSVFLFSSYVFLKTRRLQRALIAGLIAYAIFFVLGTLPSWIAIATLGWTKGFLSVNSADVAGMFLSPQTTLSYTPGAIINTLNAKASILYALFLSAIIPVLGLLFFRKQTIALIRNARSAQIAYHGGLLCVGAGLAWVFSPETITHPTFWNVLAFLLLIVSTIFAWLATVVVNDVFDEEIDRISNPHRPLISQTLSRESYKALGWTLGIVSVWFAAIAHPFSAIYLIVYHAFAFLYNAPPFRLKRFPILATFTGAIASVSVLFAGYAFVDKALSIEHLPWQIIALLVFAYTISLPAKDFKDIAGDSVNGIKTLPVILGERNARIVVASGVFLSFMASIVVFNVSQLFMMAFFFGATGFWIISRMPTTDTLSETHKKTTSFRHRFRAILNNSRLLPHIIILLVFVYGLILGYALLS